MMELFERIPPQMNGCFELDTVKEYLEFIKYHPILNAFFSALVNAPIKSGLVSVSSTTVIYDPPLVESDASSTS